MSEIWEGTQLARLNGVFDMKAGIVIYRRDGDTLEGRWTHKNVNGAFAREVVHAVPHGTFEGEWSVDLYDSRGNLYWVGNLTSAKKGDAFLLHWKGKFEGSGKAASFVGIAGAIGDDIVVSSFEPVD